MPQTASMRADLSAFASGPLLQFPVGSVIGSVIGDSELVLVPGIGFQSLCAEHLLPYDGVAHIGYLHGENHLGPAEFARIVAACSGGIQDQQRFTTRMGLWLHHQLAARGVGVLVEGGYTCATDRGGAPFGGPKTTLAFYGSLRQSADEQREFLALTRQELGRGKFGHE
ncbi:GTP cyclohydrolase 1 [Mycobacterium simulans]|uniref:GTP cyclohydrolase I n=1 Tax=Mycobacterium simulans TaxID=627089 RepID=UPI00174EA091|nr:GTP cyclohydrolase I [Mycobacterium simulans]SON59940.1 GTP cyclohydrolase 1 [Mycobacterium simulans]